MNSFAVHPSSMLPDDHQRLCGQGDDSLVNCVEVTRRKCQSVSRTAPPAPAKAARSARYSVYTKCLTGFVGEPVMQDPLSKADRYWKEAAKCYELAKSTSPTFLSGFYRQAAMQFLFMAEGELKVAERQTRRRDK